jgi:hypothetical protein
MSVKKTTKKRSKKARAASKRNGKLQVVGYLGARDEHVLPLYMVEANHPFPVYLNPESAEEREKRIAKRKARTLRIFQTAYENHRNKAS